MFLNILCVCNRGGSVFLIAMTILSFTQILNGQNVNTTATPYQQYLISKTAKEYNRCVNVFKSIDKDRTHLNHWDYFMACQCAIRANKIDEAEFFLKQSILLGLDSLDIVFETDFNDIWKKIRKEYNQLRDKYFTENNFDMAYMIAFYEIWLDDNRIRWESPSIYKTDSTYWVKMDYLDSINTQKFYTLIATRGWPGYNKIGSFNDYVIPILIHIEKTKGFNWDSPNWKMVIEKLNKAIENGKESPKTYATLFDSYLVQVKNKSQRYGTMIDLIDYKNYKPIMDIETIDSLRNSIGLPSLYIDSKMYGRILPNEYKYE